ncbi:hypothetical protein ASPACDRAFT_112995 [Aspergillus aculeatus ATCC 16872]|uniref:Xylanolytic transcriptional activator regulatory domain-containing protein n=1 Tax=Aspergillus aculeatus (strain ATCC 16872 / CBS 172.66 / WB 5094) TaxID=690307 RepID=A0A1L9X2P3_ASPA1|nr:uncharacterized protein ASPACDRAFT_112995 [Aspergillus aculeatus ATCC 16872]OJK02741.1 hypothetical protein ASPACDRAFT_112995 [Aspergillus aculeatus ATCC 16872]
MLSPVPASGPAEIGSLTAHSLEESEFVGSSSGVYFIKTVRRAFSHSLDPLDASSSSQEFPPPEDTLVGSEGLPSARRSTSLPAATLPTAQGNSHASRQLRYDPTVAAILGKFPPLDIARELMMMYFKVWHPLFPFLHGPSFLNSMEALCSERHQSATEALPLEEHRSACWTTIFQCVFNLASLLCPEIDLPRESRIESSNNMHALLGTLSCRHDILSVQALLASQLYLVAKMSLRTASTVGGCMLRSILHAGLHRCPYRYKELTSHDRQLRKRIFWSAYAIDRYLSQTLGLPLGIQDSDIDVCPPLASEIHIPGSYERINAIRRAITPSTAGSSPISTEDRLRRLERSAYSQQPLSATPRHSAEDNEQHGRELVFASYVESGKLTGRAIELFHKSILVRSVPHSSVLFLITDVHKWWNSLSIESLQQGGAHQTVAPPPPPPPPSSEGPNPAATVATNPNAPFNFAPFFTVLYQHLILLINRPSLSLNPSSPEFCSGLQTCIGAAREILAALTTQQESGQAFFWPGFLSAAWMSGLVLAFACQLRQYVLSKGSQEISKCLTILENMAHQWETAKQCHKSLSLLSRYIHHHHHHQNTTASIARRPSTDTPAITRKRTFNDDLQQASDHPAPSGRHRRPPPPPPPPPPPSGAAAAAAAASTNPPSNNHLSARDPITATTNPTNTTNNIHNDNDEGDARHPTTTRNSNVQAELSLDPGLVGGDNHDRSTWGDDDHPGSTISGFAAMDGVDADMMDLLQGSNFDDLADMFGQQFPTF